MTQTQRIKAALDGGERLTGLDALRMFGCFRLGARVHELKREGMPIVKQMVKTPGGKIVAEYRKGESGN